MWVAPDEVEIIRRNVAEAGSSRTTHTADPIGADGRIVARHERVGYARRRVGPGELRGTDHASRE